MKHQLIMENWRRFLAESHSEEQEQDLKDISGELKKAVKMHQSQADRIDDIVNATPDDELDEAKNKDGKEQGADGKACWKGYRYDGTEDGKDKCVPMEEEVKDKYDDEVEKDNEKKSAKARKEMGLDEKKKACKPSKGKRSAKRVDGKCRSFGQSGKAKDGGDRIRPGTAKGDAYCARSAKIKKCKEPPCANDLSRKKWKCRGDKSVA